MQDQVALVTGASRGIGRAIALELARGGMHVAVLYAGNEQAAQETCREIAALSRRAVAYRCDVSDFEQCKQTVAAVAEQLGAPHALVNNAGITADGLCVRMSEQQWDACVDVNLKGAFHMVRHAAPLMMRARAGRIVNISSVAGIMGNAGQANYAAAKAGLIGFTKSVARELAPRGVTCNAVAPGFIATDMTDALPPAARDALLAGIPMRRGGESAEVAALVAFLVSPAAAYITGTAIPVDGGLSM